MRSTLATLIFLALTILAALCGHENSMNGYGTVGWGCAVVFGAMTLLLFLHRVLDERRPPKHRPNWGKGSGDRS